jgi:hypothetical protein
MKTVRILFILITGVFCLIAGCAGTYVGVGVHTPGPWGGPYPGGGGTVIVGRPMPSSYFPNLDTGKNSAGPTRVQTVE